MGRHPRAGHFPKDVIVNAFGLHQHEDYATLCKGFWGASRFHPHGSGPDGPLLDITIAFDLTRGARYLDGRPVIEPDSKEQIINDLILAGCTDVEHWDEINNKCATQRALSAAVGILFNRPESFRRGLEGFKALIEMCFHSDGQCKESPSYAAHHMRNIWELLEILRGYFDPGDYEPEDGLRIDDFNPFEDEGYRLVLEGLLRMLAPGRQFPPIADTFHGTTPNDVMRPAAYTEILMDRYDGRYAALHKNLLEVPLAEQGDEYALWYRDPDLTADTNVELPLRSEWFPGWHVGVLRTGNPQEDTAFYLNGCDVYDWTHSHRHQDTLSVIYFANGLEMALDRGYMGSVPHNKWMESTVSHNLVRIDGVNQNAEDRRSGLELFGASSAWRSCRPPPARTLSASSTDAPSVLLQL